jgi:hypothetical protein
MQSVSAKSGSHLFGFSRACYQLDEHLVVLFAGAR